MGTSTDKVKVERYEEHTGAVVGSFFNDFNAPKDTKFELYESKSKPERFVLHGENERLEYEGRTESSTNDASKYLVGIYNPVKKTVELYKAPLIPSKVISKSSKHLAGPRIKSAEARASTLRTALGEAFGTKKAKKAISDLERYRIDADKLADSAVDIVDFVKTAAKDLPTREELQQTVSNDRPTPLADVNATDVEQAYPIHNIIPKREMAFIRAGPLMKETDKDKKLEMLPYSQSQYIVKKLDVLAQSTNMTKHQLLYYLSLLIGVYNNRRCNDKNKLLERLNAPPEALIDGILDSFTILRPGQFGKSKYRSFTIDPQNEDRLLCYILVIILHLDNFIVEISPMAQELGLKPSKLVNLFRVIGCVVKGATVAQADAFGIPKSSAATYKIATLKVPLKLPEMTRRGRAPR